jgi:hypothetical protein
MEIKRIALIFDTTLRPETAGVYCQRALERLADVRQFQPHELDQVRPADFDLFLNMERVLRDAQAALSKTTVGCVKLAPTHQESASANKEQPSPSPNGGLHSPQEGEMVRRRELDAPYAEASPTATAMAMHVR